jgi:ribosomal-protein-alanine N-acetyltransferase
VQTLIRVEGTWPGAIELTTGWFRAHARPWNDSVLDPMLRLERGGAEFLTTATRRLIDIADGPVYSPALYPGSTRAWRRAGFEQFASLLVMERPLGAGRVGGGDERVTAVRHPDWGPILDVDRGAFEGFWGMSGLGLEEAYQTNRSTVLLTVNDESGAVAGYAIVGSQWGTVYLHRIAVHPSVWGAGLGSALLAASINWGNRTGARSMVLNVRPENERARLLYERYGFTAPGSALEVLRHAQR